MQLLVELFCGTIVSHVEVGLCSRRDAQRATRMEHNYLSGSGYRGKAIRELGKSNCARAGLVSYSLAADGMHTPSGRLQRLHSLDGNYDVVIMQEQEHLPSAL